MNELDKNLDMEDFEPRVYEIGYHVVPTVAEDNLISIVDAIREFIVSTSGVVISEDSPKSVDLAYSMDNTVSNKKTIFDTAYFGWMKFEGNPGNIIKIKDFLDKNEEILRFIIIKTVKESTLPKKQNIKAKSDIDDSNTEKVSEESKQKPKKPKEEKVEKVEKKKEVVSEEEVDKAIEELVA